MDTIYFGILSSNHHTSMKLSLLEKVCAAGRCRQDPRCVQAVLDISMTEIINGDNRRTAEFSKQIFEVWSRDTTAFITFFDSRILDQILADARIRHGPNAMWVARSSLKVLQDAGTSKYLELCELFASQANRYICDHPDYETNLGLCELLLEQSDCIPTRGTTVQFCSLLLRNISTFRMPEDTMEDRMRYLRDISTKFAVLLQRIWSNSDSDCLFQSLLTVFKLISVVSDVEPSRALGAIVQAVPRQKLLEVVDVVVNSPNVSYDSLLVSLQRMVDWLYWPYIKNIDLFIVSLLHRLATVHKFNILMRITEMKIQEARIAIYYSLKHHLKVIFCIDSRFKCFCLNDFTCAAFYSLALLIHIFI